MQEGVPLFRCGERFRDSSQIGNSVLGLLGQTLQHVLRRLVLGVTGFCWGLCVLLEVVGRAQFLLQLSGQSGKHIRVHLQPEAHRHYRSETFL